MVSAKKLPGGFFFSYFRLSSFQDKPCNSYGCTKLIQWRFPFKVMPRSSNFSLVCSNSSLLWSFVANFAAQIAKINRTYKYGFFPTWQKQDVVAGVHFGLGELLSKMNSLA